MQQQTLNIKSLGAEPILCSVLGKDLNGGKFQQLMKESDLSEIGLFFQM